MAACFVLRTASKRRLSVRVLRSPTSSLSSHGARSRHHLSVMWTGWSTRLYGSVGGRSRRIRAPGLGRSRSHGSLFKNCFNGALAPSFPDAMIRPGQGQRRNRNITIYFFEDESAVLVVPSDLFQRETTDSTVETTTYIGDVVASRLSADARKAAVLTGTRTKS